MGLKILTICPSYGRPQRLKTMIDSFLETSRESELSVWVNIEDPFLKEYEILKNQYFNVNAPLNFHYANTRMPITEMFNMSVNHLDQYDLYHQTNDDFVYITPGWDRRFLQIYEEYGEAVIYGNDLLQGKNLPTAPCISQGIIRALGWIQLPGLTHLGGDCVWKDLGVKLNRLFYLNDVIIEHRHWMKDKSLMDQTYLKTNSQQMYDKDQKVYREWKLKQMDKDIERIKKICHL